MSIKAFLTSKKPSKSNFRIKEDFIAAVRLGELLKIEKIFKKPDFIEQMKDPIRDEEGNSMLLLAIKSDHREVFVRLLQDLKVDVNVADSGGVTPLHLVSGKGWIECVNLLVKFGANINAADHKENLPIHWAAANGRTDVIALFLNQNVPVEAPGEKKSTPLWKAAHSNHYDSVILLLDKKADVNAANTEGVTPLLAALMGTGDNKLVEKLIDSGALATVVDSIDGKGTLHYAAKYNKHECMNAVVQAGAQVSAVDKNGMTPLHDAGLKSCRHCINLLLLLGCDVKARDANGSTPLHHLVTIGDPTSANMLLSFGAEIDAKDNEGLTPLAIALRHKRKTIAKLLIDKGASTDFLADESNQSLISANVLLMITAKDQKDLKFSKDKTAKGPQIRAATVDQLVYRLTYELHPDVRYQKIFLLTYRAFMTSKDLLNRIIARFNIGPPKEKQNDPEALKGWQKSIKLPVQLRVINVLRSWIENHFRDFYHDTELLQRVLEFLEKDITDEGMKKLAAQLIKITQTSEEDYKAKEAARIEAEGKLTPRDRGLSKSLSIVMGEVNLILNVEPEQLARQLCLIEFDLYSALQPKEFLNQAWNKGTVEAKNQNAPNIRLMIANSNKITMWVATEICQCKDLTLRAEVVNRFIRVAKALYDLNNFNGLVEVLSGFGIAAVNRLNKTWALVKLRKQLEQLREVTHPDKNFAKLREHVHNSNPPIIPYLGTYLSDLTFIDDGNPNTVVEDGIELINFFKQRLSAEFILEVQQYQQQGYNIDRDTAISNYLRQYQPQGEKELFDISLEIEPREKS